jgi:membrane-anchored protein YejM (alkaline phosphatase superfamily)
LITPLSSRTGNYPSYTTADEDVTYAKHRFHSIANLGMIFPELAQNKARAEEQKAERQKGKAKEKWKGARAKRKAAWKAYLEAEGRKANRSTKSRYEKVCVQEVKHYEVDIG